MLVTDVILLDICLRLLSLSLKSWIVILRVWQYTLTWPPGSPSRQVMTLGLDNVGEEHDFKQNLLSLWLLVSEQASVTLDTSFIHFYELLVVVQIFHPDAFYDYPYSFFLFHSICYWLVCDAEDLLACCWRERGPGHLSSFQSLQNTWGSVSQVLAFPVLQGASLLAPATGLPYCMLTLGGGFNPVSRGTSYEVLCISSTLTLDDTQTARVFRDVMESYHTVDLWLEVFFILMITSVLSITWGLSHTHTKKKMITIIPQLAQKV